MKRRTSEADRGADASMTPTDLELMLWVDGELHPARAVEVDSFLAGNERARAVVASLRLGGEVLASDALSRAELPDEPDVADSILYTVEAEASRRFMVPARKAPAWTVPAVTAIGLAFAVAAAFVLVIRSANQTRLPLTDGAGAVSMMAPVAEEETASAGSIAVVDFGARSGTVLYVPSDGDNALAVVWLSEDDDPSGGVLR